MANHASLSKAQAESLLIFLRLKMPESIDDLVEEIGKDDAFRVSLLMDRLERLSGDELEEEEED